MWPFAFRSRSAERHCQGCLTGCLHRSWLRGPCLLLLQAVLLLGEPVDLRLQRQLLRVQLRFTLASAHLELRRARSTCAHVCHLSAVVRYRTAGTPSCGQYAHGLLTTLSTYLVQRFCLRCPQLLHLGRQLRLQLRLALGCCSPHLRQALQAYRGHNCRSDSAWHLTCVAGAALLDAMV